MNRAEEFLATTTKATQATTRAEMRRAFADFKRLQRYEQSGFLDISDYAGVKVNQSKYVPHIGKKEKGITGESSS